MIATDDDDYMVMKMVMDGDDDGNDGDAIFSEFRHPSDSLYYWYEVLSPQYVVREVCASPLDLHVVLLYLGSNESRTSSKACFTLSRWP